MIGDSKTTLRSTGGLAGLASGFALGSSSLGAKEKIKKNKTEFLLI